MIARITSKRTSVLMALLMLGMALLVVSANSAYADNFEPPVELPFTDDFGTPPGSNDVPNWSELEDQDDYCAVKNAQGGEMALQLSNGCDAYVTIEMDTGATLFLEYDWGQHITSKRGDAGDLSVFVTVRGTDEAGVEFVETLNITTHDFLPDLKMKPDDFIAAEVGLGSYGLSGRPYMVEVHFMGTSSGNNDWAWVDNVNITRESPLPRGTVSYTHGFWGQSPEGEAMDCEVLATMESYPLAGMDVDAISAITAILSSPSVNVDMAGVGVDVDTLESEDVDRLCLFLVGEIGTDGGNNDGGFLPAGKVDGKPVSNLASQDIALRLNLNLDGIYGTWGDEGVDFRPIYLDYYLNIDPVPDPDGVMVYPLDNTFGDEALGSCGIGGLTVGLCADGGGAELTALGALVRRLDVAGTTVGDMLAAADALLLAGATAETDAYTINTVGLTQLDVTNILSLINKS